MTNNQSSDTSSKKTSTRTAARRVRIRRTLQWLGFPGGGLGLAATIHGFFYAGQPILGAVACIASIGVLTIAIAAKFFSELLDKVLDRIEERLEQRTDSLADWIVAQLEEGIIGLWWKYTPQFRGKYYQSLIYACRTYTTQGLKTPGAVTPDLDKVFVPLRVNSRSLAQISPALIQRQEAKGDLSIWDFLAESRRQEAYKRMAIIGAPGSGKTTLLRHITLTYAHHRHRQQNRKAPTLIPILLQLHKIRDQITTDNAPDLATLTADQVTDQPAKQKLQPPSRWFEDRLLRGKCLVMLDGLDEVPDETQRRQVSQWVDSQIRMFPENVWILSSRPFGYQSAQLQEARTTLGVLSFSLKQMQQFLNRWYLQNEILRQARKPDPGVKADAKRKADDLIHRIQNYPPLAAMALNPLLLTMIATVHDNRGALPGSRVELYDEICDVLLVRRQEAKGLTEPLALKAAQKQSVLQTLALDLMIQERWEFCLIAGSKIIRNALKAVAGNTISPEDFIKHIQNVSGLLVELEQNSYQFAHLSFQEYLAAAQLKETQQEGYLINHLENSWWHETIRLYAANNDTTAIVEAALNKPSVISLMIAYDCSEGSKSLAPIVRQRLDDITSDTINPEIAKLTAEVKLARRLIQLLRIDEDTQIDQSYISEIEFKLFLNETGKVTEADKLSSPCKPIAIVSLKQALEFCRWLNFWNKIDLLLPDQEGAGCSYYRLPTIAEAEQIKANEHRQINCWTIGFTNLDAKGLRIAKTQISPKHQRLYGTLVTSNWHIADQITEELLLRATHRSSDKIDVNAIKTLNRRELIILDQLWFHSSDGKFGFGAQINIWEALSSDPTKQAKIFASKVGWSERGILAKTNTSGHFPYAWCLNTRDHWASNLQVMMSRVLACKLDRGLLLTTYEVVTINTKGFIRRKTSQQARYFVDACGKSELIAMVAVPGGRFLMGSPEEEEGHSDDESPQHRVSIAPFWMSQSLITQAQWKAVAALPKVDRRLNANPSNFKGEQRPVEQISWYEAVEFCNRLSRLTQHPYRLPTEAEWEYACRAGTNTAFYFGPTITTDLANYQGKDRKYQDESYSGNYGQGPKGDYRQQTTSIGSFPPNKFGLYDMHGNVWEWCQDDWYEYERVSTDSSALLKPGARKVLRGGSWDDSPEDCRSACRLSEVSNERCEDIGFRVVSTFF